MRFFLLIENRILRTSCITKGYFTIFVINKETRENRCMMTMMYGKGEQRDKWYWIQICGKLCKGILSEADASTRWFHVLDIPIGYKIESTYFIFCMKIESHDNICTKQKIETGQINQLESLLMGRDQLGLGNPWENFIFQGARFI